MRNFHGPLGLIALLTAAGWLGTQDPIDPPRGPFGLSRVTTASGKPADIEDFFSNRTCSMCHKAQRDDMKGSMHSVAHAEPFYRAFAELARKEAGEEVYTYCSGCHAPSGVVTGLIPGTPEEDLPREVTDAVSCDVCHQISALTGTTGPWGEPGNASFVLDPGRRMKYGPLDEIDATPAHDGEAREFLSSSEFCASCHTIIHPINGLRIEHTYDEWKDSVYAENGIQCQDCHMRSIEDAIEVARTLKPVKKPEAPWATKGEPRPISAHTFVGGNVMAGVLSKGKRHAELARQRLRSAATLGLEVLEAEEGSAALAVTVTNIGAGHALPTSLTELREMWVHVRVTDAGGELVYESGGLDAIGDIAEGAIRFGAHTVDAQGEITYKPWEAVAFGWKRLVPPKGSTRDELRFEAPEGAAWPLGVEARLLYRTAPPKVVKMVMGEAAFDPEIVVMTTAQAVLEAR